MTPRSRRKLGRAIASFAALLTAACAEKGDPVRRVLDELVSAAEQRDAPAIVERLAPDFQAAEGTGRADAEATLRRYFAAYERLGVRVSDLTIERATGAARMRFRADLSGSPRKVSGLEGILPRNSAYRFDLRLAPDAGSGRWLVTWAGWEQVQ